MNEMENLVHWAREHHKTICSCESLTAGLFAASVASVPGASAVLKGGLVTYFTQMKEVLAHVPASLIEEHGVISKACATAMAGNTRKIMDADYCVSFTGNAGPDVMEGKKVGEIWCAIAGKDQIRAWHFLLEGSRNEVREKICFLMAGKLLEIMEADQ